MGAVHGKHRLTRADRRALAARTHFTEKQIKKWHRIFLVSSSLVWFFCDCMSLVRRNTLKNLGFWFHHGLSFKSSCFAIRPNLHVNVLKKSLDKTLESNLIRFNRFTCPEVSTGLWSVIKAHWGREISGCEPDVILGGNFNRLC